MKKIYLALFLCFSVASQAQAAAWSIENFDVKINVAKDGMIVVEEKITADFTTEPHHGIYRYIPLHYTTRFGNARRLRTRIQEVSSSKKEDQSWVYFREGQLYVKVGNSKVYYREKIPYTIRYSVDHVLNYFASHDELYWNVTGNEWDAPIRKVRVTLSLPESVDDSSLKYTAFLGSLGSTDTSGVKISKADSKTMVCETTRPLSAYEGLTIVLGVKKGILGEPNIMKRAVWFFQDNWPYGICIIFVIFLFLRWLKKGRDPSGRGSIMVTYQPPAGMTPGEAGALVDEKVNMRDITATLIDLAVRGHLTIQEESDHDFLFRKKQKPKSGPPLKPHEEKLMDAIFSIGDSQRLSSLKNKFYKSLRPIQNAIYQELVDQNYFLKSPLKIRTFYRAIGILTLVFGFFLFVFSLAEPKVSIWFPALPTLVCTVVCGLLLIIFARLMPQKTTQGVLAFEQIKGLREYINRAEAETVQKVDVASLFERLLPFAMCFGLTKSWTKAFSDLYKTPPQWFTTYSTTVWSMNYFSQSLNHMEKSSNQIFTSMPRSSGSYSGSSGFSGGSSGGGFGGGGGGSW